MTHTEEEESESVFDRVEVRESSTSEQYYRKLDIYLLTPLRILWDDWRARTGCVILLIYIAIATIGVAIFPEPVISQGPQLLGAFQELRYPLGTDMQGRGVLSLMIYATPNMLKMIIGGAVFSTVLATVVGTAAGYKGGTVERVTMTITDTLMTIPGLPLIIVLATIITPTNPYLIGVLLSINAWAGLARSIRAQTMTLRDESYIEASRVLGHSTPSILRYDIIPQLLPYVGVSFMQSGRRVIFSSVGLYFLGVLPHSGLNWGVTLNQAFSAGSLWTPSQYHWLITPIVTIVGLSLGMILLTQGMDRVFNPRVRSRHAKTTESVDTELEH